MLFRLPPIIVCFALSNSVCAQNVFLENVKVEFEKVVYIKQMIKEVWNPDDFQRSGQNLPLQSISYFSFIGDTTKSIYRPTSKQNTTTPGWWENLFPSQNAVYCDYTSKTTTAKKQLFEESFIIHDTFPKIKWKFTGDKRTIAGFDCHKAIGILNDTIGIFAFYSDQLLINGGPESINGLPGLILGLGIPRLHTTWFATKVETVKINNQGIFLIDNGKNVTKKAMIDEVNKVLTVWYKEGSKLMLNFIL